MGFESTFRTLRSSIGNHNARYDQARGRSATLFPYLTSQDVLAALTPRSGLAPKERDGLTVALISEHNTDSHAFWSSVLLVVYEPMLRHLAGRLNLKNVEDLGEAEARIVLAFLETIASFPVDHPPTRVVLHLRRRMAERFFASVKRDQRMTMEPLDDDQECAPHNVFGTAERLDQLVDLARVFQAGPEGPGTLDVFLATVACRESMVAYMNRTCGTPVGWKVYKELCNRRMEALAKLRTYLAEEELDMAGE